MHKSKHETHITVKSSSNSYDITDNVIYAIADVLKQSQNLFDVNGVLCIQLALVDPFLVDYAWHDALERVRDALRHYASTRQLSLSIFTQITLSAFVTNFGESSEVIWT